MELRGLGDRWLAGETVEGIAFGHHERVEVTRGHHDGQSGSVALLLGVDPEPLYLVQLDGGRIDIRVRQSALRSLA